jgi:hypothetical protein
MLPQAAGCSCCQYSFRLYTTSILFPFIFISSQLQLHGRLPRIGLGNAPELPKRSVVPYSRAVAEKDLYEGLYSFIKGDGAVFYA